MRLALYRAAFAAAAVTSLAAPVAAQAAPPENLVLPSIARVPQGPCNDADGMPMSPCTGDELLGSRGTWTDQANLTFRYQWLWCDGGGIACQRIPVDLVSMAEGADPSPPYILAALDLDRTLKLRIYARNSEGETALVDSSATAPVRRRPRATAPIMTSSPALSAVPSPLRAGQRVTATLGSWDDDFADYHYRVQWWRCDASGQSCAAVTDSEFVRREGPAYYDITEADTGSTMRAQFTVASFDYAKRTSQFTDATPLVEPDGPPRLLTGPFLMVGGNGKATVRAGANPVDVGDVLTAAPGTWALADPGLYSVRWMRCDRAAQSCVRMSEVATPDAPAEQRWSYRVQTGDDGRSIRAEIVAVNRIGSVTTQTPAAKVGAEPAAAAGSGSGPSDGKPAARTVDISGAKVTSTLRGVTVTLRVRRAGTLTVTAMAAKGGAKLGNARKKVAAPGKVLVTVPLSRSAQKAIASGRAVRASLKASLADADGGTATGSEKVTLRRPRR